MNVLRRVNKGILLPVIGIIIALVLGLYPILAGDKHPNISLVVLSSTNVLDVHEPIEDLSITFQGKDIQKEDLNLKIYTLKMVNDGEVDIPQNQYDINDVWGIKVNGGEIMDIRLIESNSDYIKSNLNPKIIKNTNTIELEKIIFDRGNYFVIEILVLHEKQEVPQIAPVGKIAGIERIEVREIEAETEGMSFVQEVYSGNFGVQIVKTIVYFFIFLGFIGLAIILSIGISGLNKLRKRNSRRNEFMKFKNGLADTTRVQYAKQLEVLSAINDMSRNDSIATTKELLDNVTRITENRKWWVEMKRKQARTVEELEKQKELEDYDRKVRPILREQLNMENDIIEQLAQHDIVSESTDGNVMVDSEFRNLLEKFIEYLKKKGLYHEAVYP